MKRYQSIIFGNFGNDTIALMQWAKKNNLSNLAVVSIDTGWSEINWEDRVAEAQTFSESCGYDFVRIKPKHSFAELVKERQSFPNTKFHWCTTFLKGLPINQWLDENDFDLQTIIYLGYRKVTNRRMTLLERIEKEQSQYYGNRLVKLPIFTLSTEERNRLVKEAGFRLLLHPSMECHPCIYYPFISITKLEDLDLKKVVSLEHSVKQPMFDIIHEGRFMDRWAEQKQAKSVDVSSEIEDTIQTYCPAYWGCGI